MNTKYFSETNLLIYATDANALITQFPRINHNCNVDFITFKFSNNFPLKELTTSIHRAKDVCCHIGSFAMTHSLMGQTKGHVAVKVHVRFPRK